MSKIKCLQCGEILESKFRHDFQQCCCDNQAFVDGGLDYLRCGAVDMSKIENIDEFGPQKQPSSVNKIEAEKKNIEKRLQEEKNKMIDKDKIDRLIELQSQINEIKEEILNDVYYVAKQINSNVELDSWNIDQIEINIDWHDYWAYGGYAHEYLSFPLQCLYDEKYLNEYINDLKLKKQMRKENEEKVTKAARKREYIRLKEEFENDY